MENPRAPQRDEALLVTHYRRSPQQSALLGLQVTAAAPAPCPAPRSPSREQGLTLLPLQGEEVDAKPPDAAEDLRDEVGTAAEPGTLGDTQASCPGLAGTLWLPLPSPGAAVQHQLPRVQRPGQHQHEVSAYPCTGLGALRAWALPAAPQA